MKIIGRKIITACIISAMFCTCINVNFVFAQQENADVQQEDIFEFSEVTKEGHNKADNASTYVDLLVFNDEASSDAHNVTADGGSKMVEFDTSEHPVGEYIDYVNAMELAPATGIITFDMAIVRKDKHVYLEFEEMHDKELDTFAYYVNVDGTDVYLRAFQSTSAGPCHYFVSVPDELTAGKEKVTVTLRNVSDYHARINRVWAWSDFAALVGSQEENLSNKMDVNLYLTNWPNAFTHDVDKLLARWNEYLETYGNDYDMYNIGLASELHNFFRTVDEIDDINEILLDYLKEHNVPYSWAYTSFWGGTPIEAPDGKGGFFGDLPYGQIIYDPLNINGRGNYQTTTPNNIANWPWMSFNNECLNEVRQDRYFNLSKNLSEALSKHRLLYGDMPNFSLYAENEPIYFAYNAYNSSPDARADFSKYVVDYAKKKGVNLDPTDGLSLEERNFLWYNLNDWIIDIMNSFAEGVGNDYILVDNGKNILPKQQLSDDLYTHTASSNERKSHDLPYDLFELHQTKNSHFGDEGWGGGWPRYAGVMDYILARGKFAAVNAEHGYQYDFSFLHDYYTYGAQFVNFYNAALDDPQKYYGSDCTMTEAEYIKTYDNCRDELMPTPLYGKEIFTYMFEDASKFKPGDVLLECNGFIEFLLVMQKIAVANTENASMTFKVDNNGQPLSKGLMLQIGHSVQPGADIRVSGELYAGSSTGNMKKVADLDRPSFDGYVFDVSDYIDKNSSNAYFKIVIHGFEGVSPFWASLYKVSALEPFTDGEYKTGHTNGFMFNREQTRYNNIMISTRADVEQLMEKYESKNGKDLYYQDVEKLYSCGMYNSAKTLLLGVTSLTLPAKFMIRSNGKLANFPIDVEVEDKEQPVSVKLNSISEKYDFDIKSDEETKVTLTFDAKAGKYSLMQKKGDKNTIGVNYLLTPDENGDIIASDGKVKVIILAQNGKKPKPKQLSVQTALTYNQTEENFAYISQDKDIGQNAFRVLAPYAENVDIKRGPMGAKEEEMQDLTVAAMQIVNFGEQADITLNDNGEVEKIRLYYLTVSGNITKVIQPELPDTSKPEMFEVTDANGEKYLFQIGWLTTLPTIRSPYIDFFQINYHTTKGSGLKKGDYVSVDYMPKTGDNEYYYATKVYDAGCIPLFEETFMTDNRNPDPDAMERLYSQQNVSIIEIYPDNNIYGLSPISGTGQAVWKITSPKPIRELAVEYSGHAINGGAIKVSVAGENGRIFKHLATLTANWSEDTIFAASTKSPMVVGGNTVYVKVDFQGTSNPNWNSLKRLNVMAKVDESKSGKIVLPNSTISVGESVDAIPYILYDDCTKWQAFEKNRSFTRGNEATGKPIENTLYVYDIQNTDIVDFENDKLVGKSAGTTPVTVFVKRDYKMYRLDTNLTVK